MATTITLPDDLAALVQRAIDSGAYAEPESVLRDALEAWQAKRDEYDAAVAKVRRLWDEGLASGEPTEMDWDELRREIAKRATDRLPAE